ncbi:hypothetical protein E1B28_007662 [Marasmius oreades]|uniref:Transcription factor IIIC 90kDa subunit N-terminal domain-containing protein n=1 Tax=Marasmius oreades TaxID=181124 RepID=A0A9P7S3I3_9AGAR|nr:uncharacterized protein E1B28_007662 [Marasmius oreades]KAG7094041.1 hypothetical protein E1B28_007662 [Marasmius oreades]
MAYYTCLNFSTILNSPSSKCLQWSSDGQACFVTKSAVYILTPEPGINHDLYSLLPSALQAATLSNASTTKPNQNETDTISQLTLNWFRTMIQYDSKSSDTCRWPDFSQEFCAVSLGSIDPSIWFVTFSPSGVGPSAGCVICILTTNMNLSLWISTKNALKGEWIKILDIVPVLLDTYKSNSPLMRTLCSQVVSVEWTSQADFGIQPTPSVDGSLLVCGTRAGTLIFLRFSPVDLAVQVIGTVYISKEWITHISVTLWAVVEPGTCEATLAYATSQGKLGVIAIRQTLSQQADKPISIECDFERLGENVAEKLIGVTALKWFEVPNRTPILAYTTPGILRLWASSMAPESPWCGTRTYLLKTHKTHVASSNLHPVVGLEYLPLHDLLLVCLLDGSFHVVKSLSTSPALDDGEEITRNARKIFERVEHLNELRAGSVSEEKREKDKEKEKKEVRLGRAEANTTSAFSYYDHTGIVVWIHELTRPADFSYKHDAKHNSMLVVARLWDGLTDEAFLRYLTESTSQCKAAHGVTPLHVMRPILFHMRSKYLLDRLHAQILGVLSPQDPDSIVMSDDIALPTWCPGGQGALSPDFRKAFRNSLIMHLFGWDALMSLRMKLSLADYAWKLSEESQRRIDYGNVAEIILTCICHRNLRTMLRHLSLVAPAFTVDDIPFVLRMVVQSLLPGALPELSAEGERLSTIVHSMFDGQLTDGLHELCPACHVEVPLENIVNARCSNGHVWSRCSVTTFILSTPDVRTCIGCTRKAFLPLSMHKSALKMELKGWFVEELLEAVHRCLFCGNTFVSVL